MIIGLRSKFTDLTSTLEALAGPSSAPLQGMYLPWFCLLYGTFARVVAYSQSAGRITAET
jgi:hypothetical protein